MKPLPNPSSSSLSREAAAPCETYIDWGPELPSEFASGRARLMVVNPTTLHLSWETASGTSLADAEAWLAEVRSGQAGLQSTYRIEGIPNLHSYNCWMTVEPKSSGFVRILAVVDGQIRRVADLSYTTPADRPSSDLTERWGSLDPLGGHVRSQAAVLGNRVSIESAQAASPYSGTHAQTKREV